MPEPIYVMALGASTAVGRDAWSSAAAVRAGISGFAHHPYMVDASGDPMRVAAAPWLDIGLSAIDRFTALLFPAIDQALPSATESGAALRIAISLGIPGPRPGLPADLQFVLVKALRDRYRQVFSAIAAFPSGHASALLALDVAVKRLAEGVFDACVLAGVDSYLEPETLEWLETREQLHGAGLRKNPWGFIPGEAAGAILLVRGAIVRRRFPAPLARIRGIGTAFEPKRMKTDTVCIGEGLTQAFRGALLDVPMSRRVTTIYCDMNGEPYRADEYGFTMLRTGPRFDPDVVCLTPADCCGDTGAASGVVLTLLAASALAKNYSAGDVVLVFCGSEDGSRGAAVVESAKAEM